MAPQKTYDLIALSGDSHDRQRSGKHASVPLAHHPRIADDDHAEIVLAANQPANTLLEGQRGLGKLIVAKRITAGGVQMLDARPHQGVVRRSEWQLLDDNETQRLALDVDTLPKAGRTQQHSIAIFAKLFEQPFS